MKTLSQTKLIPQCTILLNANDLTFCLCELCVSKDGFFNTKNTKFFHKGHKVLMKYLR